MTLRKRTFALLLPLALAGFTATRIPWEEMTPVDWVYSLATRFSMVEGHSVHYPTPPAELARLLEGRPEVAALRHLADAKLSLGDRKGALETMEKWAAGETALSPSTGAEAWAETARWAVSHQELAAAFKAAEKALPGLTGNAKRALADQRIAWAEQHPDQADAMVLRKARANLFPQDAQALEVWLRALEKAGRLEEADQALIAATALSPERNLLLRSDLQADHGDHLKAFQILDGAISRSWEPVPKPPRAALGAPGGSPQERRDEHSGSTRFEPDAAGGRPPPQPEGTAPGGRSAASAPFNDEPHRPAGPSLRSIPPDAVAARGGFGTGSWSIDLRRAYAMRVDRAASTAPNTWRTTLETRFDPEALVRLATYFQGQNRGDAASGLLRQMARRYEKTFSRKDFLLLARLHGELDEVPEAFRSTLAAAHLGNPEEQTADLARLARLALRAGGRPLPWGTYNDEAYRWVASLDRTPGFWTGGLSFLLTGQDWKEPLEHLESESLSDRTFATARKLAEALVLRAPKHDELPTLRVALMERHVERGEGSAALALLPLVESAPPEVADEARRVALLAARQVKVPIFEELRLYKARLKYGASDGSKAIPGFQHSEENSYQEEVQEGGEENGEGDHNRPWSRPPQTTEGPNYSRILEEALSRLERLDTTHRTSLNLILGEMDRLPEAESLWMMLASRLEGWNLDDELGPRYQSALQRFQEPGIWGKAARWYARRNYQTELRRLAEDIAGQFRGAALFQKASGVEGLHLEIPEQPRVGEKIRLVSWADWVRFKAMERFPHSPTVFRAAQSLWTATRWQTRSPQWQKENLPAYLANRRFAPVVVPDALMEARRWAILFADPTQREIYFSEAMREGTLEEKLLAMEGKRERTPVEDQLLFEGWARLSQFERAAQPADRLTASYPGDGGLAHRVLSLHRSLNGLESSHAGQAHALVERTAPTLEDPGPLWTELGELEEDRGRPLAASAVWQNLLARQPRNAQKISELATLLWDYNHDQEALAVVEEGRKRIGRPRFFAFETGVLRENMKDLEGAVREYLDAVRPEAAPGAEGHGAWHRPQGATQEVWREENNAYGSWFERDQRSLRRLMQLMSREKPFRIVARRIKGLVPGVSEDERALAAFFPLANLEAPDPGLAWDADAWIDALDLPNDPQGREQREDRKETNRPKEYDAVRRIGDILLEKAREMVPKATAPQFLEATENWSGSLIESRWTKDRTVSFHDAVLARRAQMAPSEEERIRQEVARAGYLSENGRAQEADAVWAALDPRIGGLPEGNLKLHAEADRAAYLERAKGIPAAAQEWKRITTRYPWSLGLLEDRLAFLNRVGMGAEALTLLEDVVPLAASGHREALLERLTREALAASDLPRTRRAVEKLLAETSLYERRRLGAAHLLARLSLKENPAWDPFPLAKVEITKLKPELHANLYQELARAADLESAPGPALGLWIEALNRRTERPWLQAAARSAAKSGRGPELLAYFEKQHERSPRDVRWAVAVRDLKQAFHDVGGAIAAAKVAVAVRPEKEELWREAVELLVRGDRVRDAADYLEGWNRPRPADEGVARWRGELYVQAGDARQALAIEQATLAAFAKEAPTHAGELAERKARAAERLFELGNPDLALRIYSSKSDIQALKGSKLSPQRQSQLALLTNQFVRMLGQRVGDEAFLQTAASVLRQHGRPEQNEEVQAFLLRQLFPAAPGQPNEAALKRWWSFVGPSGLEPNLRLALAQRLLSGRAGPWQTNGSFFAQRVGQEFVAHGPSHQGAVNMVFKEPDLPKLWMQDLARRDRSEELLAFIEPRWVELLQAVKGQGSIGGRLPWSSWMDDLNVLKTWARAAAAHPEKVRELSEIMGERRLWDRFWGLAARGWQEAPLVSLLPESPRLAWFRFWEPALPRDPQLLARRLTVEQATAALGRLVKNVPGAVNDPYLVKLRGPQTVGETLGKDSQWLWPEFALRKNLKGEVIEEGDDRVIGQGIDQGRLPGALWGERPGEAWYVLEALARYRQGHPTAPFLPLEVPQRGSETSRTLLALRLAQAMGDLPLALELEAAHPGPDQDRAWLEGRLSLWVAAGQREQAAAGLKAFIRKRQPKMTEDDLRWLSARAEDLGLPAPLDLLDPERPVGPVFLAYLKDRRPGAMARFSTGDEVGFRTALAHRWSTREAELSAEQIRFWLRELWAMNSAPLPRRGLSKLGKGWAFAGDWLEQQPVQQRLPGLDAWAETLDPAVAQPPLLELLGKPGSTESHRMLALRLHLLRNEKEQALALVDGQLAELRRGQPLSYTPPDREEPPIPEGEDAESWTPLPRRQEGSQDPLVSLLQRWLKPFQAAKQSAPVEARFLKLLEERRSEGPASVAAWRFAFLLSPPEALEPLARDLDAAWFRGELSSDQLGPLLDALATSMPLEAPRWLARWPQTYRYAQSHERAAILKKLKQPAQAAHTLLEARRRSPWQAREEVEAFDSWRRLGAPMAPEGKNPEVWTAALPFWKAKEPVTGLGEHLKAHPHDLLASRSALRSLSPADEETLMRVAATLSSNRGWNEGGGDALVLRLRASRGLTAHSWRAAQAALGSSSVEHLYQVLVERRFKTLEINQSLADVARISFRAGDERRTQAALRILDDRGANNAKALRAELGPDPAAKPEAFRLVDGRPIPIRPRDLTWPLLASLIQAEAVR